MHRRIGTRSRITIRRHGGFESPSPLVILVPMRSEALLRLRDALSPCLRHFVSEPGALYDPLDEHMPIKRGALAPVTALLENVSSRIRRLGMSKRTEASYTAWIRRFITFCQGRHPALLGPQHVEGFLTRLSTRDHVAPATQNQALAALLFLYKQVLGVELEWMDHIQRAKRVAHVPVV